MLKAKGIQNGLVCSEYSVVSVFLFWFFSPTVTKKPNECAGVCCWFSFSTNAVALELHAVFCSSLRSYKAQEPAALLLDTANVSLPKWRSCSRGRTELIFCAWCRRWTLSR